jgi:uncharacterized sodium:solute symporter family permease YidK
VQRYLTARSVNEARHALLMSAYWKIPLQFVVLLLGVLVYVFYTFNQPPLLFHPTQLERVQGTPAYAALQSEFDSAFEARRTAAANLAAVREANDPARLAAAKEVLRDREAGLQSVRTRASELARETSGDRTFVDINYIIPTFILTQLPIGLVGLLIVAIILAATDTIAGELNSLSTATVIDFYKRRLRQTATPAHYLAVSKIATGLWGLFACGVAVWAADLGSLIEVVNRFGSFFYGSILGVFILAVAFPRATGNGAFIGLLAGMGTVAWVASFTRIAFLWHNVVGAVTVVIVGSTIILADHLLLSRNHPRP